MMYRLEELLAKMGAPEVKERQHIEWHYFDKNKNDLAGYADIRLEAGGERLVAELKRTRENYEDDHGNMHAQFVETFHLIAERTARPGHYRIARIAFDGDVYEAPQKAIIELGLSVFHARALDISIRMVEQTFNKDDILTPAAEPTRQLKFSDFFVKKEAPKMKAPSNVVPFRQKRFAV